MPIGSYVGGAVGIFIGASSCFTAMMLFVVPSKERAARQGYVLVTERVAAVAQLDELRRQVTAGKLVISSYQEVIKNVRSKEASEDALQIQDRKDFEARLASLGRSCGLDRNDVEWLLDSQSGERR